MMDNQMIHNKKSIISEHYGVTPALLEDHENVSDQEPCSSVLGGSDSVQLREPTKTYIGIDYARRPDKCIDLTCSYDNCTC